LDTFLPDNKGYYHDLQALSVYQSAVAFSLDKNADLALVE
jgi:hypothetical protein